MNRRSLLSGLLFVAAAPVIVRATSLMPIRAFVRSNGYLPPAEYAQVMLNIWKSQAFEARLRQQALNDFSFYAGMTWQPEALV